MALAGGEVRGTSGLSLPWVTSVLGREGLPGPSRHRKTNRCRLRTCCLKGSSAPGDPPREGGPSAEGRPLLQKHLLAPGTASLPPREAEGMAPGAPGRRCPPEGLRRPRQSAGTGPCAPPCTPTSLLAPQAPQRQWGLASQADLGLRVWPGPPVPMSEGPRFRCQ